MKTKVKIRRCNVTSPIDFGEAIALRSACGIKLTYTEYGFIRFDSGDIVMFDAYSSAHIYKPFKAECGIVAFPFYCGCNTDNGERVAYAGLRFDEEKAVEWKPLHIENDERLVSVDPDAIGVPINSGVCCMSDAGAYAEYRKKINGEIHPLAGHIVLDGQTHDRIEIDGRAYAVFSTGWGDGCYNCYCGISAGGKITAIIADFGLIEYPKEAYELVETEVEVPDGIYVYDPEKTETQNHIERWSRVLDNATGYEERLRALSRRGYAYHSMGDTDSALADYTAAVECCKYVTDRGELLRAWSVYDNAAEIYCARGDYDSAITLMLGALEMGDDFYAGAYVRLIDLYNTVKRSDDAAKIAERMLDARPNDPVAHIKYAESQVAASNYGAAAWVYEKLASEFKLYENLFDEASCLIELGDYEKAGAALDRHPANEYYEQYWYYKAYIDFKRKKLFSALENAEKAYSIDNEYMPAIYLLIDIQSLFNSYRTVARYAEEYKRLRPENEFGYSVCADAHLFLGNISESARNYCYLFDRIKQDDKYAALAAITCEASGEHKRGNKILKYLRRKHSEYYYGALYGVYVIKYRNTKKRASIKKPLKLIDDVDFLTMLSVFLLVTGNVTQSSQILESLGRSTEPNSEIIAQQIRTAERIGDKKHFISFIDYYIDKFIDKDSNTVERREIAERFIGSGKRHRSWIEEITH